MKNLHKIHSIPVLKILCWNARPRYSFARFDEQPIKMKNWIWRYFQNKNKVARGMLGDCVPLMPSFRTTSPSSGLNETKIFTPCARTQSKFEKIYTAIRTKLTSRYKQLRKIETPLSIMNNPTYKNVLTTVTMFHYVLQNCNRIKI